MNPAWQPIEIDAADIQILTEVLTSMKINLDTLPSLVKILSKAESKRGSKLRC
jgi:hypothetical protein